MFVVDSITISTQFCRKAVKVYFLHVRLVSQTAVLRSEAKPSDNEQES